MPYVGSVGSAHRARFAHLVALVAAVLVGLAATPAFATAAAAGAALDPEERALCKLINKLRAQTGAPPLRASLSLTKAASWLSFDMVAHDSFDHIDSRGRDFDRRLPAMGYKGPTMAENLAGGEESAAATFKQLKSSALHRRTMVHKRLKVIGVGRARGEDTMLGWYWTTTFGGTLDRSVAC